MQATSELYQSILADNTHWFETRVVVGDSGNLITEQGERILFGGISIIVARTGPDAGFPENYIFSVQTHSQMLDNGMEIGRCIAQEIEVKMLNPSGDMPRMSAVIPYVRACTATQQSEWLQQGVFFIDTREITHNDDGLDILTFHGYDAMLKGNQPYGDSSLSFPATDTDVVAEIAAIMGVDVDPRTWDVMDEEYQIEMPSFDTDGGYTLLETLGYIASMYFGSFIITEQGELRLVSLLELPPDTRYLVDEVGNAITFGIDKEAETVTASGAVATFTAGGEYDLDELEIAIEPVQDLHGYDAPYPEGAVNLFDTDTFEVVGGKYIDASGNIQNNTYMKYCATYIGVTASTAYYISCKKLNTNEGSVSVAFYNSSKTFISRSLVVQPTSVQSTIGATFTTPSNTAFIRFNTPAQSNETQVIKGSTAPDKYYSYSNICPISGHTGVTVNNSACLLSFAQGGLNDSSGTENASTMRIRSDYIPISELGQTINVLNLLRMNRFDTLNVKLRYFYWYTSNKTFIENSGTFGLQFPVSISSEDIPSNTGYFRIVLMVDNVTDIAPDNYRVSVNAEQPIPISWQDKAGTVYKGTLNVKTGVLTAIDICLKFGDSSLNWTYESNYTRFRTPVPIVPKSGYLARKYPHMCSCYKPIYDGRSLANTPDNSSYFGNTNDNPVIFFVKALEYGSNVTNFLNARKNDTFVYEIATPVTYQLSPQQVQTLVGQNNLLANTGNVINLEFTEPASEVTRILV